MATQKKIDKVTVLKSKLAKAKAFFFTEYKGLTHKQLETLRKSLKKVEAEYVVAKNSLTNIAVKEHLAKEEETASKLSGSLQNSTGTLFAYGDPVLAVKALSDFIKNFQLPKIKLGFFEGKLAIETDFAKISTLPSREVLLATLLNRINSPIQGLHYALSWNIQKLVTVLDNVKGKKS